MDPKYKEKLKGLSIGAMGGKDAYEEIMRKKNPTPVATNSDVDQDASQRFRDVQQAMVDRERRQELPVEPMVRPPQVSPELEQQMLEELMAEEPQPPVQSKRFNKLLGR